MGKILLVRHGQASLTGEDYDVLSDLGAEQSRLLGDWFARNGNRLTVAVTGGQKRHEATAAWCLSRLPDEARPRRRLSADKGFEENDLHEVLRAYRPDLATPSALRKWLAESGEPPNRPFQKMFSLACERWVSGQHDSDYRETWKTFSERAIAAIRNAAQQCGPSETLIVFTSAGPIAAICQHLLGIPNARLLDFLFAMHNSSVTRLVCRQGRIGFSSFNSIAHLECLGRPEIVTYR